MKVYFRHVVDYTDIVGSGHNSLDLISPIGSTIYFTFSFNLNVISLHTFWMMLDFSVEFTSVLSLSMPLERLRKSSDVRLERSAHLGDPRPNIPTSW